MNGRQHLLSAARARSGHKQLSWSTTVTATLHAASGGGFDKPSRQLSNLPALSHVEAARASGSQGTAEPPKGPISPHQQGYTPRRIRRVYASANANLEREWNRVKRRAGTEASAVLGRQVDVVRRKLGVNVEVKNATKARLGRLRKVNRDDLLKWGPSSFDWRTPLLVLKKLTKKLPDQKSLHDGIGEEIWNKPTRELIDKATLYHNVRVSDIPLPEPVTTAGLNQYVFDLTRSTVANGRQSQLYGEGHTHNTAIRVRLMQLMNDLSVRQFLSQVSVHTAIIFLEKHSFVRDARTVFFLMNDIQIRQTTETFNILFSDIAKERNLSAFAAMLKLMVDQGVEPDSYTWFHYMVCLDSKLVKALVLQHMSSLNMLHVPHISVKVASHMIPLDLSDYIAKNGTVEAFIKQCSNAYGRRWASGIRSVNALIRALNGAGMLGKSLEILKELAMDDFATSDKASGIFVMDKPVPDGTTMNHFLESYQRIGDHEAAIGLLRLTQTQFRLKPDGVGMDILFRLFWKKQMSNACRVIWRIACAWGIVSQQMQFTVMKALREELPNGNATLAPERLFCVYRAKSIAGIAMRIDWGQLGKSDQHIRTASAGRIRLHDLQITDSLIFDGNFPELLHQACLRDLQWQDRYGKPDDSTGFLRDLDLIQSQSTKVELKRPSEDPYVQYLVS